MNQTVIVYKSDIENSSLRFFNNLDWTTYFKHRKWLDGIRFRSLCFSIDRLSDNLSLILLSAFLPSLLLKPIGGTLADRMNRKKLMIIGDFGSAIGIIFIIAMMFMGIKNLWVIYFGSIISSIFVALQNPAYKASVTDLVDERILYQSQWFITIS